MNISDKVEKLAHIIIATDQRRGNGGQFEDYTGAVTYSYNGEQYQCTVKNAYFTMDAEGVFDWQQGDFISGDWSDGVWHGGAWKNGVWHGGTFQNGTWVKGVWHKGTWKDGIFKEGWVNEIQWLNGIWKYGVFESGTWHNGTWLGGFFHGGKWFDGQWEGGKWYGGEWQKGRIRGTEYTINPMQLAQQGEDAQEQSIVVEDQNNKEVQPTNQQTEQNQQ